MSGPRRSSVSGTACDEGEGYRLRRAHAGAGVSSRILPRRPARAKKTSQMPLDGPPVVPPTEEVGGGVTCGLLVAPATPPDGVDVAAATVPVGVAVGVGVGVGVGAGVGVLKKQLFAAVQGGEVGGEVGGGLLTTTVSVSPPQAEAPML